jgi:hypothetical protein
LRLQKTYRELLASFLGLLATTSALKAAQNASSVEFFETRIRPLLAEGFKRGMVYGATTILGSKPSRIWSIRMTIHATVCISSVWITSAFPSAIVDAISD